MATLPCPAFFFHEIDNAKITYYMVHEIHRASRLPFFILQLLLLLPNGEMENQAATVASPQLFNTETPLKTEEANPVCFKKSLQELKHLSSQLHHAANHFQAAACRNQQGASQRKLVLKSTRKYICEAIVTVVDHLGSVSNELENKFEVIEEVSQVEQRIDCLAQRILTCQQYALSLHLSNIRWNLDFPRHHQHYISPSCNSLGAVVPFPLCPSIISKPSNSSISSHAMAEAETHAPVRFEPVPNERKRSFRTTKPSNDSQIDEFSLQGINIIQGIDEKKKAVHRSPFLSFLRISQIKSSSSR